MNIPQSSASLLNNTELGMYDEAKQLAHDIRSPLSALKILSQKAQGLKSDERYLIDQVVSRIDQMANELLYKQDPMRNVVEYSVQQIFDFVSEVISEKRVISPVKIRWSMHAYIQDADKRVRLSQFALKRAVCALLTNSVEALSGKPGWIRVSIINRGGRLIVRVKDSGKGLDLESVAQAFEAGFTQGKQKGSGLGLAYVKKLADVLDGKCILHSRLGFGCSVALKIPVTTLATGGE